MCDEGPGYELHKRDAFHDIPLLWVRRIVLTPKLLFFLALLAVRVIYFVLHLFPPKHASLLAFSFRAIIYVGFDMDCRMLHETL